MKKLLCIALVFLFCQAGIAGNADKDKTSSKLVAGKVTDASGQAIAGAQISVTETGESVFADFEGNFKLLVKADKEYCITINTIGYLPLKIKSTQLGAFSDLSLQELP